MALAKCPRSGKLFDNTKSMVHPDANAAEEADYSAILDYVAEHPNAKPDEVCKETGVSMDCVNRMIKCGRLKEMDEKSLAAQADEFADRSAEVARRNQKVSGALNSALRSGSLGGPARPAGPAASGSQDLRSTLQNKREKH